MINLYYSLAGLVIGIITGYMFTNSKESKAIKAKKQKSEEDYRKHVAESILFLIKKLSKTNIDFKEYEENSHYLTVLRFILEKSGFDEVDEYYYYHVLKNEGKFKND
jgi:hypothetical protein